MLHRIIEAVDRTSRSVGTLVRAVDTAGGVFATMIANPEAIISAGEPQALDGGDAVAFAARLAQVEAERDKYFQACENWRKLDAPLSEFRRVLRVGDCESTLDAARRMSRELEVCLGQLDETYWNMKALRDRHVEAYAALGAKIGERLDVAARRVVAERDAARAIRDEAIARAEKAEAELEAARASASLVTMVGDIGVRNSGDATRLEAILAERDALAAELAAIRAATGEEPTDGVARMREEVATLRARVAELEQRLSEAEARRSSEVTGLGQQLAEVVAQRDEARKDYHAAVDRALDAHRVLGANHNEGTLEAAKRVVAERDEARGSLDAVRARLADHLSDGGVLVGSLPLAIDVLAQRVKDARSDYREHDVKLSYVVDQITTIVDEAFGMQPVMTHEELLSFLEAKLKERGRDLAAARARIAELEAPLPEATVEELADLASEVFEAYDGSARARIAGFRAVAERVRRERPPCLIARAVAANIDVRVAEDQGGGFLVAAHRAGEDEDVERNVPASDVEKVLGSMLTESTK